VKLRAVAAVAVVVAYGVLCARGLSEIGLTDDDDFYLPAGASYADWLFDLTASDAFTQGRIDRAFGPNHEHPPVAKYGFGLFGKLFGFLGPIDGPRVFAVFASTLCAAVSMALAVFQLGLTRGLFAGTAAVVALASMPRFQFHSRVGTLDVPVAAFVLLAAAVALWGERSRWAGRLAGVAFGLALATKLNAPFLLVPMFLFWWLTRPWPRPHEPGGGPGRPRLRLKPLPTAFFSMVLLGPLVFWVSWPWLWFDTWDRLREYVSFHLNHYPILFYYFGERYDQPFAPWHAPFVMAGITTPVAVMALAAVGAVLGVPAAGRRVLRRDWPVERERPEGDLVWFSVLNAFFAVAPVAFSGGPKYGGVKLFMPFFPFLALLAGYGALRLWELACRFGRAERVAAAVVLALGAGSAFGYRAAYSHRGFDAAYGLSAYNGWIGGVRGATASGFERQYYDVAFRDQLRWLNAHAPERARVHFVPNHKEYVRTYKWFRKAGLLREDLRLTTSEGSAHLVVLTHERRFPRYASDFVRLSEREILFDRSLRGTPLWTVYGGSRYPPSAEAPADGPAASERR